MSVPEEITNELQTAERDYTEEQNQRVIPMVKDAIKAMGEFQFDFARDESPESAENERKSLKEFIVTSFMTEALTRKLQVNDVPYTFKLMGLVVEMLRGRSMTPDDETDKRLTDAAQQILRELGSEETLKLDFHGDRSNPEAASEARAVLYTELYKRIVLKAFSDHQIQTNEVNHVFDIMAMLVKQVQNKVDETLLNARKVAEAKMWKVEDIDNLTVLDIHQKAIEPVENGV